MTWSTFTSYYNANKTNVPASVANEVRREAMKRYCKRMQDGYADSVLDFSDLVVRMEAQIAA